MRGPVFYLIPGLGADERVFRRLRLHGQVIILSWLPIKSAVETLPDYAARLAAAIPAQQVCWLVGVSFGGVLALEIGQLRPLARVVLISSLLGPQQLPPVLQLARATGIYKLLPFGLLARLPRLAQWFFGVRNGAQFRLFSQIMRDTDPTFARWAVARLLQWPGVGLARAIRLHGTHDRLLPAGRAPIDYPIAGGGHFMIVSHAQEISNILNQLAASNEPRITIKTHNL